MTSALGASAGDNGRPQLGILLLLALPVIVMLGIGAGVASGVHGADFNVLALAMLMGGISLVPVALDVRRRFDRRHILLSFMSLAFFGLFVLSVFTNYFFASDTVKAELSGLDLVNIRPDDLVRGQLAALAGWLALLVGYLVPIGRLFPAGVPTPRRNWTFRAALMVAVIMIPLGWAIFMASQFGILPKRAGSGFLGMISNSTYMGIALLMLIYMRFGVRELLFVVLVLLPPSMAFNFLSGSKTAMLTPAAVVAVTYIVIKRRIAIRWVLAAIAGVVIIYPIAEFQRRVILRENTMGAVYALKRPAETISRISRFAGSYEFGDYLTQGLQSTTRRSDGLGILSVIMRDCPSRVPFQGGWTLGYIPLSYVPRLVWANKPDMTTGQWVTDHFGGGPDIRSATAPTWIGELYYNFGWPAIIIGMLIMGVFMRVLHESMFPPKSTVPAQMMAVLVLLFFPQTLQGSLMSPINTVVFGSLPIVVAHWGVRLLGGAPVSESGREPVRGFATDAAAGI